MNESLEIRVSLLGEDYSLGFSTSNFDEINLLLNQTYHNLLGYVANMSQTLYKNNEERSFADFSNPIDFSNTYNSTKKSIIETLKLGYKLYDNSVQSVTENDEIDPSLTPNDKICQGSIMSLLIVNPNSISGNSYQSENSVNALFQEKDDSYFYDEEDDSNDDQVQLILDKNWLRIPNFEIYGVVNGSLRVVKRYPFIEVCKNFESNAAGDYREFSALEAIDYQRADGGFCPTANEFMPIMYRLYKMAHDNNNPIQNEAKEILDQYKNVKQYLSSLIEWKSETCIHFPGRAKSSDEILSIVSDNHPYPISLIRATDFGKDFINFLGFPLFSDETHINFTGLDNLKYFRDVALYLNEGRKDGIDSSMCCKGLIFKQNVNAAIFKVQQKINSISLNIMNKIDKRDGLVRCIRRPK